MADINKVVLVGRLTRDSEIKYTAGGLAIGKVSLAVNRRKKTQDKWEEEVNFFDVVIMGKTAEALGRYLVKGKQIAVSGELRQNRWEQDGQTRSKVEIMAEDIQLLGSGSGGQGQQAPQQRSGNSGGAGNQDYSNQDEGLSSDYEDDIPF
jgi:single-strand DNA-binding protein